MPDIAEWYPTKFACEIANGQGNCEEGADGRWYVTAAVNEIMSGLTAPGIDWNPLSWAQSALSDVTGPLGAIQKWVIKQIAKAAGLIENDIAKAADYVAGRFGGVENTISHLAGEINNIRASAGGDVSRLWNHARKDVDGWIHDAIGDALAAKGAIWNDLESWGHDAEHYTDNAVSAFHRDVLRPVENGLHAAIHDATSEAEHAWHIWYKDIWGPADKIIHDAEHDAHKAVYWIDHSGLDAVHLVEKCWDFLEWVALHPKKALEAIPGELRTELPKVWTLAANEPDTATIDKVVGWLNEELPHV